MQKDKISELQFINALCEITGYHLFDLTQALSNRNFDKAWIEVKQAAEYVERIQEIVKALMGDEVSA